MHCVLCADMHSGAAQHAAEEARATVSPARPLVPPAPPTPARAQAALEAGAPRLLEVCRTLQPPPDAPGGGLPLYDPCHAAYHALFEAEAAEQLLEPGEAAAELEARPAGSFAAAAAAGGVAATSLPAAYVPPAA